MPDIEVEDAIPQATVTAHAVPLDGAAIVVVRLSEPSDAAEEMVRHLASLIERPVVVLPTNDAVLEAYNDADLFDLIGNLSDIAQARLDAQRKDG